jgi:TolA-binding protein
MSKSTIILVLGGGVVALAIVIGSTHGDAQRRSTLPAPVETQQSIAQSTKAAIAEAVSGPLLPSPAPLPIATAPSPRTLAEPPAPKPLDEASLIAKLNDLAASDPRQSLTLASDALARFPESSHAPEFEWNVVKALANMDRYQEAAEAARSMLEKYPDSPLSVDVERHVLNHPPNPDGTP